MSPSVTSIMITDLNFSKLTILLQFCQSNNIRYQFHCDEKRDFDVYKIIDEHIQSHQPFPRCYTNLIMDFQEFLNDFEVEHSIDFDSICYE
jgi:hypothetical protein